MRKAVAPVLALAAAGVLAWVAWPTPGATLDPAGTDAPLALVAHDLRGLVDVPAEARGLAALVLPIGQKGAEPTLGVTRDGAIFLTGGDAKVLKSTDRGATWRDVADHSLRREDFDPHLHVDPRTDRIYSAPLYKVCTHLMWSDDGGRSWTRKADAGCPLAGHDHQSLTTGPPPPGVRTNGYPNVVYYAYNSAQGEAVVSRSLDGGANWTLGTRAFPSDCHGGLAGRPAAAPDGTLVLPKPGCTGIRIGVSRDAGQSWTAHDVEEAGIGGGAQLALPLGVPYVPNPGAAFDAAGNGYVLYTGKDGLVHLTRSAPGAQQWSPPIRVTPPNVTSTAFSAIAAGADGRVVLAYLATNASTAGWTAPYPHYAPEGTAWHLHVAYSSDATAPNPTFTTLRVTPPDDPVQMGCIWQSGDDSPCRNLREYIDVTQRDGRAYVAYSDGCRKCTSGSAPRYADLHVAVLDAGPSLLTGAALPRYR